MAMWILAGLAWLAALLALPTVGRHMPGRSRQIVALASLVPLGIYLVQLWSDYHILSGPWALWTTGMLTESVIDLVVKRKARAQERGAVHDTPAPDV
jgi:hypothetical protein